MEMKKVKKGIIVPVILTIISLFGIGVFAKYISLCVELGEKISSVSVIGIIVFVFIIFCAFISNTFSLEYDETHFVYKSSKNAEPVEFEFSDIDKIQHYSYRSGKRKTNEYKIFTKSSDSELSIMYSQPDNSSSYKEFFSQIIKANPDVKFTKLNSGLLGSKEEKELTLDEFIH